MGSTHVEFVKMMAFAKALQAGYKNITYHNSSHAGDLCQTFNYYMVAGGLRDKCKMDNVEILSCLVSACMHDYEHPGVNNAFLVNMVDEKALRYNDVSVLENHHIAASFELMFQEEHNWLCNFSQADFKRTRALIIATVLSTDMQKHFAELGSLKSRIPQGDFDPSKDKDKESVMKFVFHMSDISNPTKDWDLCRLWTDLLFVEFFAQGDLEKQNNFPVSLFYDRVTTNIAGSQLGFIDFIIKPSFSAVIQVLPSLAFIEKKLADNRETWTKHNEEYEEQKTNGNL